MNIHDWKARRDNILIGQVLRFMKSLDQSKVVTKALDGTYYIQTIGNPSKSAGVALLCTAHEKGLFDKAESDGALIEVNYRDIVYYGYIASRPSWQIVEPGEWFSIEFNLLITDEVSV